jgi:hypothetical protein
MAIRDQFKATLVDGTILQVAATKQGGSVELNQDGEFFVLLERTKNGAEVGHTLIAKTSVRSIEFRRG